MPNGYKITRSNYTIKKRHQLLSGGVIYERDFMTTTNLGGWDSGSIPYGENNFKFYYSEKGDAKKRPYRGDWLKNDCNKDAPEIWTANCVPSGGTSEKEQIKIKQNFNSLLDFAYYGSCAELVKSTIVKIIKEFPAEMYVVDGEYYGFSGEHLLINSFDIDLHSSVVPEGENEQRYFLTNYANYNIINEDEIIPISDVILYSGTPRDFACGIFNLDVITSGQTYHIWSKRYESGILSVSTDMPIGARIFPREEIIETFFLNLDDFSKVLLNLNTNPIYSAILDTPRETERGIETYQVTYTWPVENDWNLIIEGVDYHKYIDGLLSVAEFYDEYYTNNLWRMLTHDSIKAMDITFSNPEKDEDSSDYNVGASRLEGLMWAFGRQFDEIKRTIDNIKNSSRITYDGNNNLPDYFLSDALNLAGWEIYNIDANLSNTERTEPIFAGILNGFTASDANYAFLRNLRLNSRSILSKKGTRQGIEEILSLFGLMSYDTWEKLKNESGETYDYVLNEYVGEVSGVNYDVIAIESGQTEDLTPLEKANMSKLSISTDTPDGQESDTTEGAPFLKKYVLTDNGIFKYLIPWFEKGKNYDGDLYYQQNGGWGSHEIAVTGMSWDTIGGENGGKYYGVGYDETVKYIILVDKVSDLRSIPKDRLYNGVFAYVSNLDEPFNNIVYTDHYFVLKDKEQQYYIGRENGWYNIADGAIEEGTPEGKKIYYIEHIVENFLANNPHVGFGHYDFGEEYIEYMENPLKYSIDMDLRSNVRMFYDSAYDCDGNLIFTGNTFEIDGAVRDNQKCWYFEPLSTGSNILRKLEKVDSFNYEDAGECDFSMDSQKSGSSFGSDVQLFDFLAQGRTNKADEISCDSVVNTKRMSITFRTKKIYYEDFCKFLNETVMPYLRQMLPSDVIFEYDVVQYDVDNAEIDRTSGNIVVKDIDTFISEETENNDDILVDYPTDRGLDVIPIQEN